MKLTMLSGSKGGVLRFSADLVKELANHEIETHLFLLAQPKRYYRTTQSSPVRVDSLTKSNVPDLRSFIRLVFWQRPDIVHISLASFGPVAIMKKLAFKAPFVYTIHGLPQPWLNSSLANKIKYTIEFMLLPFVASHASAIIAVSKYVQDSLRARYGHCSTVIHNGFDTQKLRSREYVCKKKAKEELGYAESDIVLLFVGEFNPYKNPLTLVEAFNIAIKKNRSLRLLMVGTGELFREVVDTTKRLNLLSVAKLLGNVEENLLYLCYNASDIFVLPSVNEAFGIVLLEAMAMRLPIIASNSGACPEVLGDAGILFDQSDICDLAGKIVALSRDTKLRSKMAEAGFKRVNRDFSLRDTGNKYLKLFRSLVSRGTNHA